MIKKIIKLLTFNEKIIFSLIIFFLVIGMILEFASIGMLVPILTIILKGSEGLLEYKFFRNYENEILSHEQYLVNYGIIFILIFFLIKYFYLVLLSYYQLKFSSKIMNRLGSDMITNYLKRPYLYFQNTNQSSLINNIYRQIDTFISNGFEPLMILLAETFIVLGIVLFLFLYDILAVFLIVLLLVLPSAFFYLIVKNKTKKLGFFHKKFDDSLLKNLSDILKSIKEIKIYQKYKEFLISFQNNYLNFVQVRRNKLFLNALPRYWVEIFLIISICSILLIAQKTKNGDEIIIFLGIFSISAFRILPSLNKIIINSQILSFGKTSIDNIYNEVNLEFKNDHGNNKIVEKFNFLEIKNLNFSYEDKQVLRNINFIIKKGEIIGISGNSGSGKSTLLDIIIGLNKPNSGSILFNGKIDLYTSRRNWQKLVGYVPQDFSLIDETIEKNISLNLDERTIDVELLQKVIKISELEGVISLLPLKEKSKIGESGSKLSGGQKQRMAIARALYFKPEILIFDESTNALDFATEKKIINNIKINFPNITIIVVSHKLSTIDNCDKVLYIN